MRYKLSITRQVLKKLAYSLSLIVYSCSFLSAQNSSDKTVTEKGKKLYLHIVLKGETVYGLSKDYSVTVRDIVIENPNAMNGISPGDSLRIPYPNTSTTSDTANSGYIYHKVVAKETAYSLAKQYKISVALLDSLNPVLKTKGMQTGQTLRIPVYQQPKPVILPVVNQPPANNPPPVKQPVVITTQQPTPKPVHDSTKEKQAFQNLVNQQQKKDTVKKTPPPVTPTVPVPQPQPVPLAVNPALLLPRYNVAVLLPFASEGSDTIRINRLLNGTAQLPLLTQISADFYQGILIAVDSLARQGLKVNMYVYNMPSSTDTSNHRLDSILKIPMLPSMNLIIGPAYASQFKIVAKFAAQHNIPIVSPLSPDNNVLTGNAFASKATPSPLTEMEDMADYIAAHHGNDNVIILHHRYSANDNYFEAFKKKYNTDLQLVSKTDTAIVADYTDNMSKLGDKIIKDKNNIIVVPYQGESFVTKLVNQLANSKYSDDDSLTVYGMHNWLQIDVLDMGDLDTLSFHFASNEYINYSDSCTKSFLRKYRYNYYTDPSYYATQGFDIGYFYLSALKKFGTGMQDHLGEMHYKGVHTSFDMHKLDATGGYENRAIYMLEYRNYAVVKHAL